MNTVTQVLGGGRTPALRQTDYRVSEDAVCGVEYSAHEEGQLVKRNLHKACDAPEHCANQNERQLVLLEDEARHLAGQEVCPPLLV